MKDALRGIVGPGYDDALLERTAHALSELAPHIYTFLAAHDYGHVDAYFSGGWLHSVAPAPSHLVPKVYRKKGRT